jgi:polyribonucleotide nucleotidyltransferase
VTIENNTKVVKKTFQYGDHTYTIETGRLARHADGAVLIQVGETILLVTVVGVKEAQPGQDFVPLAVHFQAKSYAIGKIPGGFFKREGKPSEWETLTSRLIDRPLRPLFPKGFNHEVQIIATLLSQDPEVPADIPALIGASAALAISGIPFNGPIAAARVGYRNGEFLLNPSAEQLLESDLDLVVGGTSNAVLMVESEADQLSEEIMLQAVLFGHEKMQGAIQAIEEMAKEVANPAWQWAPAPRNPVLAGSMATHVEELVRAAYQIPNKQARRESLNKILAEITEKLTKPESEATPAATAREISYEFHEIERAIVRGRILSGDPRIDGRDTNTVRPIQVELGVLPRAHGSAIFTRGETQVLASVTLGTDKKDARVVEGIVELRENFMLDYNFPPFSVGEVGFMAGPKRREIGHGKLAKRALESVVPTTEAFPYTIRVVSEVLESNGSSSMATVCGGSLALMDAGIPVSDAVAGIAMGLIKESDRYAILTDILGDEDHLGDMDFKVAGSLKGVTALQMDIKIEGITKEIMERALAQARTARLHILGIMNQAIQQPRESVSKYAPRIITFQIAPDRIGEVIGKGGATIREITESTNSTIDISENGMVKVAAINSADGEAAKNRIEQLLADVEIGQIYEGTVVKLMDFGAFVAILPGKQGLVHISQISDQRVNNVHDVLQEGQNVRVKVTEIDRQGRIRLSMKEVEMSN